MKNRLAKFLLITFGITWGCWWTDALLVKLTAWTAADAVPTALFTVGGFGPTVAACVCMEGGFSWKQLRKMLFGGKKQGLICLISLAVLEIVTFALSSAGFIAGIPQGIGPRAVVVAVVFLQAAVLFGGNEELGWRGTLQPLLQEKLPYPIVVLVVGCVWVCWHIPLWFIEGDSHQSMSFAFFAAFGMALSFWLGAVHQTAKSVAACMLLHGLTNTLMGVLAFDSRNPHFVAGVLLVTAASFAFVGVEKKQAK